MHSGCNIVAYLFAVLVEPQILVPWSRQLLKSSTHWQEKFFPVNVDGAFNQCMTPSEIITLVSINMTRWLVDNDSIRCGGRGFRKNTLRATYAQCQCWCFGGSLRSARLPARLLDQPTLYFWFRQRQPNALMFPAYFCWRWSRCRRCSMIFLLGLLWRAGQTCGAPFKDRVRYMSVWGQSYAIHLV